MILNLLRLLELTLFLLKGWKAEKKKCIRMKSLLSLWKILKTSSIFLLLRGVISKIEKILGGDCHRPVEKGNVFRFSEKNKNEIYINIGAGMVFHISFISFCGSMSICF